MKTLLSLVLFAALSSSLWAVSAKAIIVMEDEPMVVWITGASATQIVYKKPEAAIDRTRVARSTLLSVFFYEPEEFKEAKRLFENRDYAGAKEKFKACAEDFKSLEEIPGNYSSLAGYYQLECCRIEEELEELAQLLEEYRSQPSLVREAQKRQFEVYIAWDAVRTKSWPRLVALTRDMLAQDVWTGTQLSQIYYCRGLAFQGLDQAVEALNAFNGAFTADFTASTKITQKATLNCLRIISGHEEVKIAMGHFGTEDEDPKTDGYGLLQEGIVLCELWKKALGAGQPLPSEFTGLLKYKTK